ncbi:hypothetical protein [Sphingomonas sp. TX0522]|nr:hypothetical protein [Sphingomonas sp. TX0522]
MTDISALIEQHAEQFGYRPRSTRNLFSGDGRICPSANASSGR